MTEINRICTRALVSLHEHILSRTASVRAILGFLTAVLFLCSIPTIVKADDSYLTQASGPYCGLYCVYVTLKSYDIVVDFEKFLDQKYISSWDGSTMEQLKLLVEDHGAHAIPMESLSISSLRVSQHPIILHVKRPGPGSPYAHWILFLGVDGDHAWIVDPPLEKQRLPLADLLAIWDGTGLIISQHPFSSFWIRLWTYTEQLLIFLFILLLILILYRWFPKAWWRTPSIMGLTLIISIVTYHWVYEHGMIGNPSAVAIVKGNHFFPPIPIIDWDELQHWLSREDTVLVDARLVEDYNLGHIPNAINLPIDAGLVERRTILSSLHPMQPVIVYCQSEHCRWGEVIAVDLHFRGFRHVYVYGGGYVEWYQRQCEQNSR